MGRYDNITPEELRTQLLRLARLIRAMERRGVLLHKTPSILRLLGELRQMIFAYEVRVTKNLAPSDAEPADPELDESLRIVNEALDRERELQDELRDRFFPDDPDP
jgi:ActR/RegA family two-component response regulator